MFSSSDIFLSFFSLLSIKILKNYFVYNIILLLSLFILLLLLLLLLFLVVHLTGLSFLTETSILAGLA